jgi:hypothetical protein
MSAFAFTLTVAALVAAFALALGLALLWRIGAWQVRDLHSLHEDEGVPIGKKVPDVATYAGPVGPDEQDHLDFLGRATLVVFGQADCEPCLALLAVAGTHPATKHLDLVYVAGGRDDHLSEADAVNRTVGNRWRLHRFVAEAMARRQWNVAVSPYFHVLDAAGRVVTKGVASRAEHLDHLLLAVMPADLSGEPTIPTTELWPDLDLIPSERKPA